MLVKQKGFTLIEVIVILAVIAILAAIAVPMVLRVFQVTAEEGTREELQNLKEAMIGNPNKLQSTVRSDFGFLGDIGRIPANLDEILIRGALPVFTFDTAKQTGAGWNGPYITGSFAGEEPEDFKNDQLGNPYVYSDVDFTNANGELADGKITSGGPDGTVGTADDITVEILKSETIGTVRGRVRDNQGNPFASIPVDLNFPSNGTLTLVTATTDANGLFAFTSVPFGSRSVKPRPNRLVLAPNTAFFTQGENVSFNVINFSESPIVLTSLRADFPAPGIEYEEIFVDGTLVAQGTFLSGQTVPFSPSATIAASGVVRPPTRVVISAPDVQLSDIIISGAGTVALIELRLFSDPVVGVPFTVTFSDGSVVTFTPVPG